MIYHRYCKEKVSLESWIHQLQSDRILRDEVVSGLRSDAVLPSAHALEARCSVIDRFNAKNCPEKASC